jgi:hypothetical protein
MCEIAVSSRRCWRTVEGVVWPSSSSFLRRQGKRGLEEIEEGGLAGIFGANEKNAVMVSWRVRSRGGSKAYL